MSMPLNSSSVLEFHGDSYVELKLSNNVAKTFAYDVWFLPTEPDGTLLNFFVAFLFANKRHKTTSPMMSTSVSEL